jgi:hypothetical protein
VFAVRSLKNALYGKPVRAQVFNSAASPKVTTNRIEGKTSNE